MKILYTSYSQYKKLNDIKELIEHMSYLSKPYDEGKICMNDAVFEFGPNSIALKDASINVPILSVENITTIDFFDNKQRKVMEEIENEYVDWDDEFELVKLKSDFSYRNTEEVNSQLKDLFTNYDNVFTKIFEIRVINFSRDGDNINREYSYGYITIMKDFTGEIKYKTNLDLESMLLNEEDKK